MLKKMVNPFVQASESIRANIFHTFLSVLGIIIGVAALVSILSLIDGMEQYAKDQISSTTDLKSIQIESVTFKRVNQINIPKDTFPYFNLQNYTKLKSELKGVARGVLVSRHTEELVLEGDTSKTAAYISGMTADFNEKTQIAHGQLFSAAQVRQKDSVAIINFSLAKELAGEGDPKALLGKSIRTKALSLQIIGILKENDRPAGHVMLPISLLSDQDLYNNPPDIYIEAESVENVQALKTQIQDWLKLEYPQLHSDFNVVTNEFRVDQVTKGFVLFRVIMGLIVGISILVGGIGVMNVLLISVTERTSEIGIRKAMGANRRDILQLFLSESIMISLFGSLIGLLIGVLFTMIAVPIVHAITNIPFQAAYTWNTFFTISIIAILIGIIFGTYPAVKAARLDPVEAIRRE